MPLVRHKIKRYGWMADTLGWRGYQFPAPAVQRKNVPAKSRFLHAAPQSDVRAIWGFANWTRAPVSTRARFRIAKAPMGT